MQRTVTPPGVLARRIAARVLVALLAVALLLALAVVVLTQTDWGRERVRRRVVAAAQKRASGRVQAGKLGGNLLREFSLADVSVTDSAGAPLFAARRVSGEYGLWGVVFAGRLQLRNVHLERPVVVLDQPPGGRWNFQRIFRMGAEQRPAPARPGRWRLVDVRGLTVNDGRLVLRQPWAPDSTLAPAQRDSAFARALAGRSRQRVVRARGGYQQVVELERLGGRLSRVRLVDRDSAGLVAVVDSLSTLAHPFNPPALDVRRLAGTFRADDDSLWWRGATLRLPGTSVTGNGTIAFAGGALLDLRADPLALADLRWLSPRLPSEGGGRVTLVLRDAKGRPVEYDVRDARLAVGKAWAEGSLSIVAADPVMIRSADVRFADVTTDLVRRFAPDATIPRRGTLSGSAKVSGQADALRTDARLAFTEAATGRTSRVAAAGEIGYAGGLRTRDLRVSLAPLYVGLVAPRAPLGGTVAGTATVTGSMRGGWRLAGDLTHAEGAERSRVSGTAAVTLRGGRPAVVNADVRALPVSLATVGRFAPEYGLRGEVRGPVHVEGRMGDLRVRGDVVAVAPAGGTLHVRGGARVAGRRSTYDLATEARAFDPSAITRRAPEALVNGTASARGTGFTPATMNAAVAASLRDSRLGGVAVDALVVRGTAANGLARLDTLLVAGQAIHAEARGSIGLVEGRTGELAYGARVDSLGALRRWLPAGDTSVVRSRDVPGSRVVLERRAGNAAALDSARIECLALNRPACPTENDVKAAARGELVVSRVDGGDADERPGIRADSLAGRVASRGVLRGNLKALDARGTVAAGDLVVLGNAADTVAAEFSVERLLSPAREVAAGMAARGVVARGVALDSLDVRGTWKQGAGRVEAVAVQDDRHDFRLRGRYALAGRTRELAVDTFAARLDTVRWYTTRPGLVRTEPAGITVQDVNVASSRGAHVFANGTISDARDGRLVATVDGVRVADLLALTGGELEGDGMIAVVVDVTGRASAPAIAAEARFSGGRVGEVQVEPTRLTARYANGWVGARYAADSGRSAAELTAGAPVTVSLAGMPHASFDREGSVEATAAFDRFDLARLPAWHPSFGRPRGVLDGRVTVRGPVDGLAATGGLTFTAGAFKVERLGLTPRDVAFALRFAGDTMYLDSLRLTSDGVLRAEGNVAHPLAFDRAVVDARVAGRNVHAMDTYMGSVHADMDVRVRGAPNDLHVTGGVAMRRGFLDLQGPNGDLIRLDPPGSPRLFAVFDTSGAAQGDSVAPGGGTRRAPPGGHVDLRVRIFRDNFYRASPDASFQFYTERAIRARLEPGYGGWAEGAEAKQDGVIDIGRGITVFRSRAFRMARGSISLVPQPGGTTVLFLEGERETWMPGRGWMRTRILTSGDGRAPRLALEGSTLFPMRAADVGAHLSFGRTPLSLLQQSGSPLTGEATWSGQLAGEAGAMARRQQRSTALGMVVYEMGHGARQSLGADIFTVGPPDVATELAPRRIGGFRGTVFEVGQYQSLNTFVAAQLRPTWALPGLRTEHWLSQTWKLDAGFEPRFFMRGPWWDPADRHPSRSGAFGAFLTKEWGF
ncbi:MAG: hypothetical protein ACJ8AO_14830 [Gemmatimonadaceae bacterium]